MSLESLYDNVIIEWGAGYRDTWSLADCVGHRFELFPRAADPQPGVGRRSG
jgi:hypothetical protein